MVAAAATAARADASCRFSHRRLRDLTGAPPGDVAAERARVEHDGWGARLLALEDPDGLWDGGACLPARSNGGAAI